MNIEQKIIKIWYKKPSLLAWLLFPMSLLYALITKLRRFVLKRTAWQAPIPVIIVGNITVGGVGKTPLVAAIARYYTQQGWRVGIVSRGYGAKIRSFPHEVKINACASWVGDEPLLLARLTGCPVVIDPNRVNAVKALLKTHPLDVIVSDDGLQHYALARQVEIAVVDAHRGLGNQCLLPAGPLREPVKRLTEVDMVVINGSKTIEKTEKTYTMHLQPIEFKAIPSGEPHPLYAFAHERMHAVAGIGHPDRFFDLLKTLGLIITPHVFPDHHAFQSNDLATLTGGVVMTEKDAMKCTAFAKDNWYSLNVEAQLHEDFWTALTTLIKGKM